MSGRAWLATAVVALTTAALSTGTAPAPATAVAPRSTITSLSATSGPVSGGQLVTIRGTGFVHIRKITFGTTRVAEIASLTSTRLTVPAPRHAAGAVYIHVTTEGGVSRATKPGRSTFRYVAAPNVTGLSARAGTTAGGRSLTITGTNLTHLRRVSFAGATARVVSHPSSRQVRVIVPRHRAGRVDVRVRTQYGTSTPRWAAQYIYFELPHITKVYDGLRAGPTAGGDVIIITGEQFAGVRVYFGSVPAARVENRIDQLHVTTPKHAAGAVDITVTNGYATTVARHSYRFAAPSSLTWTVPVRFPAGDNVGPKSDVSCVSPTFCAALELDGSVLTYDGATWTDPVAVTATPAGGADEQLTSISCATTQFCAAVGARHAATTADGGLTWTTTTFPLGTYLRRVSCAGANVCVAMTIAGQISTYAGGRWTDLEAHDTADANGGWASLSCPSITFCIAGYLGGRWMTYDGTTWTTPTSYLPATTRAAPGEISCSSPTFCVGNNSFDEVTYRFDGTRWTTRSTLESTGYASGITCTTAEFCLAWGNGLQTLEHDRWSLVTGEPNNQQRASCASPTFCMIITPDTYSVGTSR